jgi:hypothetical protein
MDTITEGRFEDTNKIFEKPEVVDHIIHTWRQDTHVSMAKVIKAKYE